VSSILIVIDLIVRELTCHRFKVSYIYQAYAEEAYAAVRRLVNKRQSLTAVIKKIRAVKHRQKQRQ